MKTSNSEDGNLLFKLPIAPHWTGAALKKMFYSTIWSQAEARNSRTENTRK